MVNILLGKAKTGKSKYIFDSMDKDIAENKNVIFFVPSQMRMIYEEKYMNYQNKDGIIDINFTTISSFVKKYIEENNLILSKKFLSEIDKKIIINKIISENQDVFNIFKKCKNFEGFSDNISVYMDLFKKSNILEANINFDKDEENHIVSLKLKEILEIYKKYIEQVSEKYLDTIDEIQLFLENISFDKTYIENTKIYFDSYNNFSSSELKFLFFLIQIGFDITISISSNIFDLVDDEEDVYDINKLSNILNLEDRKYDIFNIPNLTYLSILKFCILNNCKINTNLMYKSYEKNSDIYNLAESLFLNKDKEKFKSDNISINFSANAYTQIDQVARFIKSKVAYENDRYSDFVIFTSDITKYENILKNTFLEYDIPVHIDSNIKLKTSIIYKYIYYLLKGCTTSFDFDNLFRILKLNLTSLKKEEISYLENFCLEYNIKEEYKFKNIKNIINNCSNYDIDMLIDIVDKSTQVYIDFKNEILSKNKANEIIFKIIEHLEKNGILSNFFSKNEKYEKSSNVDTRYMAKINNLMYESILNIFDSIEKIYDNSSIDLKEFTYIFQNASSSIFKKNIPPSIDQVQVVDINVSKILDTKYVIMIGVNEGSFPLNVKEDIFFSDKDISDLKEKYGIEFKESSNAKIIMQNYNIYEAINSSAEFISIYYISSDIDGKSLRPSSLITDIQEVLDISVKTLDDESSIFGTYNKILENLNYRVRNEIFDEKTIAMYNVLNKNERYKLLLDYKRNSDNLNKDSIESIFSSNQINSSISKLEQYKKCPFSYFVKYILKVDERKKYKITSIDIGSFMHNVLEKYSMYLYKNNIAWHEVLNDEKYLTYLYEIIDELFYELYKNKDDIKLEILKRKLQNTMKNAILTIAKSFNQSQFKPYAYELGFSDYKEDMAPIEIKISDDKVMRLVGRIDRVDTAEVEENLEYARIVDYKSSSKDLDIDDVKEGLSLQLITYLSAFIDNYKDKNKSVIKPAGVMYFNLSDNFVKLNEYTLDEEKMQAKIYEALRMKGIFLSDIKILEMMDKKIETKERLINVSMRTVKSSKGGKSLLDESQFDDILKEIKNILKDIGRKLIIDGDVSINPNKKADHCKYCKYMSICRKNIMC